MSILVAIVNVSRLMPTYNAQLCFSTDLITLCLDMLGHLGSHYLMNFWDYERMPICKAKSSTADKRGKFATHLFFFAF